MRPDIWGPHLWLSMHYIALAYPSNPSSAQMNEYHMFYSNIARILPCAVCAKHYDDILETHPLTLDRLSGPDALFEWTVDVHNMVNKDLGKRQFTLQEARAKYDDAPVSCEYVPSEESVRGDNAEYRLVHSLLSALALVSFVILIDRLLQRRAGPSS